MRHLISKILKHRRLWAAVFVVVVVFMAIPNMASAYPPLDELKKIADKMNPFNLADVSARFLSSLIFLVLQFFSMVAGVIIALQAWFLEIILSIGNDLVNSAPVRVGFPIVLSIANLFFVGALIAIAIATIIRRAEYGAKKILWKLVVMAIMVNFGLVICGTLLSLSDQTTKFFIESISPATSGPNGTTNYKGFANSIAGAFNPQAVIVSSEKFAENPIEAQKALTAADIGDDLGKALKPIISILSTLGSFVIIIITLATLNAMLMWRYVRLGLALIVLPLAWASWIFPNYQEHYKKWWTKFTMWAIFPPVVIFFIWLGLQVSKTMAEGSVEFAAVYPVTGDGNSVADFMGTLFKPIIAQTMKSFILFGLMMGGMVAAQELGVKFADAGYKAIEGAGKGAKGWAGRTMDKKTARSRDAVKRGAIRTGAGVAALGERYLPFMNKKKVLDNQGKKIKVDKEPEEKLSNILSNKADRSRDALDERLNGAGASYKQRKGETVSEWQKRLAAKNLGPKTTDAENDAEWNKRFNEGSKKAAAQDSSLQQRFADDESDADWKARIIAAHPELDRRPGETESADDWKKRVNGAIEELVKKAEGKGGGDKKDKGLMASVWGGATEGFSKGAGHKNVTQEELTKIMEEKFGLHVEHPKGGHPPASSEGGDGGGAHPPAHK